MNRDFAAESKPPATPRPPKVPPLPRRPPTIPPTPHYADTIFDLAASLGFKDLGLVPQGVRTAVAADSECRAGVRPVPGAVPEMPQPPGPPRFDGLQATAPHPTPTGPTGPVPHPPPPFEPGEFPPPVIGEGQLYYVDPTLWRALSVECPAWPASRRPTS